MLKGYHTSDAALASSRGRDLLYRNGMFLLCRRAVLGNFPRGAMPVSNRAGNEPEILSEVVKIIQVP